MTGDLTQPALARDQLTDLHRRFGLDQWMLIKMLDDQSMVVACVGDGPVTEGTRTSWTGSVEAMVAAGAEAVVGDVTGTPFASAAAPSDELAGFAAATLRDDDGLVWGTLLGVTYSATQLDSAQFELPLSIAVRTLGLAMGAGAGGSDPGEGASRVDVRRDALTGVLNDRGWREALITEDERCRRYGNKGSVAVIHVEGFDAFEEWDDAEDPVPHEVLVRQTGEALRAWRRGADVIARVDDSAFGVLLVEVWEEQAVSAIARLKQTFSARRIKVSLGLSDNSGRSLVEAASVAAELASTA